MAEPRDAMEPGLPDELTGLLTGYLDEEAGEPALRQAGEWVRANPVDIAGLLDWVHRYPATRERRARAEVVLRAGLGLPLVPGPVCRPLPK